jgi:hypothetical protein
MAKQRRKFEAGFQQQMGVESGQPFGVGVDGESQATVHVELFVNHVQVNLDRAFLDRKFFTDRSVAQPLGQEPHDLDLALG